jgi:thioredoxin reductase
MTDKKNFDVIITGGSYAGLSAALALGRALRKVLIIDGAKPCNRHTPYSHNFITHDGEKTGVIAEKAKEQVLNYDTVRFLNAQVTDGAEVEGGYCISTATGEKFFAIKLVFATGLKDIMPSITGYAECWGTSILHCPYCHGYEVKNEKTAILANGEVAFQFARLISNWTKDLIILTNGKSTIVEEQCDKLAAHNIQVFEEEIAGLNHENGHVRQVFFHNSSSIDLKVIYSRPDYEQHCPVPNSLGCELNEQGLIKVDMFQKTTVEGVFACGDNSSPLRAVSHAVATGGIAGAMVNLELTEEAFH